MRAKNSIKFGTLILVGLISSLTICCSQTAQDIEALILKAEQGDASAQFRLGMAYHLGRGVPQSDTEAEKWNRKAVEQGDANAQNVLGMNYQFGRGVPKDSAEAVKWFRKAAEQGLTIAQNNLGAMYANGQGVPQDYISAYKWHYIAASNGLDDRSCEIVSKEMTSDDIEEAQKRARICLESNYEQCD